MLCYMPGMWKRASLICLLSLPALAQRSGGPPRGGTPAPPPTAAERERAATAVEFADMIEKARASVSPPPLPQIRFPTENEKALSRLRLVEDQRKELRQYLDKLWSNNKDAQAQKTAFETLWRDAEKPKWMPRWVRPAIEDYYKQQSKGLTLISVEKPKSAEAKAPIRAE
jgi:hypothetical protein